MSQKKITKLILESISMSKLAMVLVNPMFKFNTPAMVYKEVDHELKTLEYLVKHFENNLKIIKKNFSPKKFNSKRTHCDKDCGCS